jgi:DNA replication and repair protein RecF
MQITNIQLANFRCFSRFNVAIEKPILLISGLNGSGKTSLLEALHYACYLRSFRTHIPRELVHFEQPHFFIKLALQLDTDATHEIQIGFSGKKKLVKIDKKVADSYKELLDYYRIVTVHEEDLTIIKGAPEIRRLFIDQAIVLENVEFMASLKQVRQIVQQRNALLLQKNPSKEHQLLWAEQLWNSSIIIQKMRNAYLMQLLICMQRLMRDWFGDSIEITGEYLAKNMDTQETFQQFIVRNEKLFVQEFALERSLFGAHLDDFTISFRGKASRLYASRGQQKLIVLLLKIAQLKKLAATDRAAPQAIFLIDDFMSDFDQETAQRLLELLINLKNQLIFTSPVKGGIFEQKLLAHGCQQLTLA